MKRGNQAADVEDPENTIRFIVATDLHVGYGEKDAVRKDDSFNGFEEVLKIATEQDVDFILCGGDLFHDNKPSRECRYRVIQLLRKYCLNDRPVSLQFNSDAASTFNHSNFPTVNYEDCNLNVGLPFFTIHGNHDDLSGARGLTALDPLHEAGLINLFGKFTSNDKFEVNPVLMTKGRARVALYGLGSQRDDRLARAFIKEDVKFLMPRQHDDEWFNVLVLHQNRPIRSTTRSTGAHIDERLLPRFAHLVVWGHEHECRIDLERVAGEDDDADVPRKSFITQPGSTVATSLSKEEAGDKKIALVTVPAGGRGAFTLDPITLNSTRPYIWEEVILDSEGIEPPIIEERQGGESDELLCHARVTDMIERAMADRREGQPDKPLIRLRVVYSGRWAKPINNIRFGAQFGKRVANPRDILLFQRRATAKEKSDGGVERELMSEVARKQRAQVQSTVEEMVGAYFAQVDNPNKQLSLYNEDYLCGALKDYVMKNDATEFARQIDSSVQALKKAVIDDTTDNLTAFDVETTIEEFRLERGHARERKRQQRAEHEEAMDVVDADAIKKGTPTRPQPSKTVVQPKVSNTPGPSRTRTIEQLNAPLVLQPTDSQKIKLLLAGGRPSLDDDSDGVTPLREVQAPKKAPATTQKKTKPTKSTMDAFVSTNQRPTRTTAASQRRPVVDADVSIVEDTPPKRTTRTTRKPVIESGTDLFADDSD